MPYHIVPAGIFAGASILLAGQLFSLFLQQPRDAVWYSNIAAICGVEWILFTLVHRLVIHPLAKYPGSLLAALTDWYVVYWIAHGGRHLELHKYHKKHGKFVRYGPARLSINSVEASKSLYDVKANTFKSDAYGGARFFFGTEMSTTIRNHKAHAFRRRINVSATTSAVVKDYEALATPHVDYFIKLMGEGVGAKSDGEQGWGPGHDMSLAVAYCIADIMGSVTFNRSWNTQRVPTYRHLVKDSPLGVAGIHLLGHMQSIFRLQLHKILFRPLINGVNELQAVSRALAVWRFEQTDLPYRDIWSFLVASKDPQTGAAFDEDVLIAEAANFVVAGTDTTITVLSSTLFYLVNNQRVLQRLTREIREAFPLETCDIGRPGSEVECPFQWGSPKLQMIKYLQACIDEAMRISPPLPSVLPREVGHGGIMIDGEFFPQGVNLAVNCYSMHHDEANFSQPTVYAPERFIAKEQAMQGATSKPTIKEPGAFAPFGVGRTSCIGKNLAYHEISIILARLVWLFDLRMEPGNTKGAGTGDAVEGRRCKGEYQLKDHFVSAQDGPVLQLRYRAELKA